MENEIQEEWNLIARFDLYFKRIIKLHESSKSWDLDNDLKFRNCFLPRDIYAFFPLLIKYVDSQKNNWIKNNTVEAEDLYNHVAEIFNILNVSVV